MQEAIREELPRIKERNSEGLVAGVADPDQVDEDWLLRLIEGSERGRFAQALAPSVSQDVCPAYIRSALEHIRDAIAKCQTAYLAQAAELAGNPGQLEPTHFLVKDIVCGTRRSRSGKTKTLVLRLARILAEDVEAPRGVRRASLIVRSALANSLAELKAWDSQQAPNLFIGTVHGFCLRHL